MFLGSCHVLILGEDIEQRVVPLFDVDVQQAGRREGPAAGGARVAVQRVVVVLVLLHAAERRLVAARDMTAELRHTTTRERARERENAIRCNFGVVGLY